jgi:hypothetical protein
MSSIIYINIGRDSSLAGTLAIVVCLLLGRDVRFSGQRGGPHADPAEVLAAHVASNLDRRLEPYLAVDWASDCRDATSDRSVNVAAGMISCDKSSGTE